MNVFGLNDVDSKMGVRWMLWRHSCLSFVAIAVCRLFYNGYGGRLWLV